ncbi:class I adenylate-forming enzyme family protein [Nonomuraea wenchangensis]|uniref:class I adenylate-forming enzyme family protein n=1 Tax=Nonomuraea wenchangensis TaxID=568860 RepID=UPI00384D85D0
MNHPSVTLSTSWFPADERSSLIETTAHHLLARRADEAPEVTALTAVNQHGEWVHLTYGELFEEAQRVATALRALVPEGSHVALWAPNVAEWPVIQYGTTLAGMTLVCLNPLLREDELEYALRLSEATVLIHARSSRDIDLAQIAARVMERIPGLIRISLEDTASWRASAIDPRVTAASPDDPDRIAMMQFTSGTTGRPKAALLRHRSVVNVARFTMERVAIERGGVLVNPLPLFHSGSCVSGTLGALWLGGTHLVINRFDASEVLDIMIRERATAFIYVPTMLAALVDEQRRRGGTPPPLHRILGGAANVPASLIAQAEEIFHADVFNVYGQTELAPVLAATSRGDDREDLLGTVGRPLPQVEVRVVDTRSGEVVPLGQPGEICARGYQQTVGYYRDPELTAETIDSDGFVHTGDIGVMDERGYLKITGRLKELIIRGGENIAPAEIETCLTAHEGVAQISVVGLPDDRYGEIVAAFVIPHRDAPGDLIGRLRAFTRERLAPYKVPTRWFVVESLPMTASGKVKKFEVVSQVKNGTLAGQESHD